MIASVESGNYSYQKPDLILAVLVSGKISDKIKKKVIENFIFSQDPKYKKSYLPIKKETFFKHLFKIRWARDKKDFSFFLFSYFLSGKKRNIPTSDLIDLLIKYYPEFNKVNKLTFELENKLVISNLEKELILEPSKYFTIFIVSKNKNVSILKKKTLDRYLNFHSSLDLEVQQKIILIGDKE